MNINNIIKLANYLPKKFYAFITISFLAFNSILSITIPYLIMKVIDASKTRTVQFKEILIIIIFLIGQLAISSLSFYLINRFAETVVKSLREAMFERALSLPMYYFDNNRSGQISSGIINDTEEILDFITGSISPFFSGIITLIGSISLLFIIDYKITLLLLISIPSALLLSSYFNKKESEISNKYREKVSELQSELNQSLSSIRLIKSFGTEKDTNQRGQQLFKALHDYGVLEGKILGLLSPISSLIVITMLIIVFGYGSHRVSEGSLSNGQLIASVIYLFQLADPFESILSFFVSYQKFQVSLSRINDLLILDSEEDLYSKYLRDNLQCSNDFSIRFSRVNFQYHTSSPTLIDINCEIPIGKQTAVIGVSGSGKSTFLSLIERFYIPNAGKIFYLGKDIQSIDLKEWRKKISYVSQETQIIYGTLLENLTYGTLDYDFNELEQLTKELGLFDYIQSLPDKYESLVGENGAKLSGGQKQRISLIRAIIRKPSIVLLDEPTSALDNNTEAMVQSVIEKYLANTTIVVVAHRLNTIVNSDQVIVMSENRIQLIGTHNNLLSNPLYQNIIAKGIDSDHLDK